jgi:hypothetical protein
MRSGTAFAFAEELLGDLFFVVTKAENPSALCFDAALETIRAASGIFSWYIEKESTEKMEANAKKYVDQEIRNYAADLEKNRIKLEYQYKKAKVRLENEEFQDRCVLQLARSMCEELKRISEHISAIKSDQEISEDPEQIKTMDQLYELQRKAGSDYNDLVKTILRSEV